MAARRIRLIVHDVRSAHNVGSILRSADGFGVERVYLTGYTPYPSAPDDKRLPHVAARADDRIGKTALGAEKSIDWQHSGSALELIARLKDEGFRVLALEQTADSTSLPAFKTSGDLALLVGSEVGGVEAGLLKIVDKHLQIPMSGAKESFNVSVATAVALYHLRFGP